MLQPSRMYIGDNINVFGRGSLVMEHPGSAPVPITGKPILFGGAHGTIGNKSYIQLSNAMGSIIIVIIQEHLIILL